jgi:hypothetical protein
MSITFSLANNIYRALKPHEDSVRHIEALFLWNRPLYSFVFLLLIEVVFVLVWLLQVRKSCIFALVAGGFVLSYTVFDAIPGILPLLFSFEIIEVPDDASNTIRGLREISAFLTTSLSIWTKMIHWAFQSVSDAIGIGLVISSLFSIGAFFFITYWLGDFWFVWGYFHLVFVLPGILLLPSVENWLLNSQEKPDPRLSVPEGPGEGRRPSAPRRSQGPARSSSAARTSEPPPEEDTGRRLSDVPSNPFENE